MTIETAINEDLKQSMTWFNENSLKANPDNSIVSAWQLEDPPLT